MVTVAGAKVKLSMTISCTGPLAFSAGVAAAFISGVSSIFCVQPASMAAGTSSRNRVIVFRIEWRILEPLSTTVNANATGTYTPSVADIFPQIRERRKRPQRLMISLFPLLPAVRVHCASFFECLGITWNKTREDGVHSVRTNPRGGAFGRGKP